jgi:hypothetical protein
MLWIENQITNQPLRMRVAEVVRPSRWLDPRKQRGQRIFRALLRFIHAFHTYRWALGGFDTKLIILYSDRASRMGRIPPTDKSRSWKNEINIYRVVSAKNTKKNTYTYIAKKIYNDDMKSFDEGRALPIVITPSALYSKFTRKYFFPISFLETCVIG